MEKSQSPIPRRGISFLPGKPSPPPAGAPPPGGGGKGRWGPLSPSLAPPVGELSAQLTERAGDGLPRRGFAPPRNDRTGDAGPLRPLRGHLPQGGRQGSVGFSGLVLAPPVGELAAELTERAGYGLPRRGFAPPRNDRRTGDAGPLRPLRGTSPKGGGKGRWGPRAWSWLPLWGSWQRS